MERVSQPFGHGYYVRELPPVGCAVASPSSPSISLQRRRQGAHVCAATTLLREDKVAGSTAERDAATNQSIREGHFEADLVDRQASKEDDAQPMIADRLRQFNPRLGAADVCVVGCGPAGLALAAELASNGVHVALVGRDQPFVNNYGVWTDEYSELGLEGTLDAKWEDALCYFGEGHEIRVGRSYGRVCRRKFRAHLLEACHRSGVQFLAGEVENITYREGASASDVTLTSGAKMQTK